jgi:HlyD family secretion protein
MKTWIVIALLVLVPGVLIALVPQNVSFDQISIENVSAGVEEHNPMLYREAEVKRGNLVVTKNSTGKVEPVLKMQVGSLVSGAITELLVDYNDEVKEDQVMARIDSRTYKAAVDRDEASLTMALANVAKVKALLEQARNDEKRAAALREINEEYLSDSTMDQYKFKRRSLEEQLKIAEASVKQAEANLRQSELNLSYTDITSPVNGIVIDRKVNEGQKLVSRFAASQLFVVAPDMDKEMHIYASVNETDIGYIRDAERRQQSVEFTVDAYPEDLFQGTVHQIIMNPVVEQNEVIYPVVVKAPNPDLKLMPGMTANISFQIEELKDIIKIPNEALDFFPPDPSLVRPEDKKVFEIREDEQESLEDDAIDEQALTAADKAEAVKKRHKRHVWVFDGHLLRAVEVTLGPSDKEFSELIEGDVQPGQKLVAGVEQ